MLDERVEEYWFERMRKKEYKCRVKYGVVFVSIFLCLFIISLKNKYASSKRVIMSVTKKKKRIIMFILL